VGFHPLVEPTRSANGRSRVPAGELLRILAKASDRHPILENFNVFDRFNIPKIKATTAEKNFARAKLIEEHTAGVMRVAESSHRTCVQPR
jgi:hypothetical protein